jgi:hypothetical protein
MTTEQLKEALDRMGVNPERYDLAGGIPIRSEGLVLAKVGDRWLVKHFERGSWYTLVDCDSLAEGAWQLLAYASDPFYDEIPLPLEPGCLRASAATRAVWQPPSTSATSRTRGARKSTM